MTTMEWPLIYKKKIDRKEVNIKASEIWYKIKCHKSKIKYAAQK